MSVEKVLAAAKAEVDAGYREGANNDTKFGKWYGLNNQPWCAMYVSWCFKEANLLGLIAASSKKGFASCDAGLKWFAKKGQVVPVGQAKPGDIAFFQFDDDAQADHVGIVQKNDGKGTLWVYEGNTSGDTKGSQSNGDGAFLKKRAYKLIMGVARPAYSSTAVLSKTADEARAKA
jgi:cell wall-associated NlpC family hydrolase